MYYTMYSAFLIKPLRATKSSFSGDVMVCDDDGDNTCVCYIAEKAREHMEVDVVAGGDGALAERQHRLLAHAAAS